jgi:hypothetical protein
MISAFQESCLEIPQLYIQKPGSSNILHEMSAIRTKIGNLSNINLTWSFKMSSTSQLLNGQYDIAHQCHVKAISFGSINGLSPKLHIPPV